MPTNNAVELGESKQPLLEETETGNDAQNALDNSVQELLVRVLHVKRHGRLRVDIWWEDA